MAMAWSMARIFRDSLRRCRDEGAGSVRVTTKVWRAFGFALAATMISPPDIDAQFVRGRIYALGGPSEGGACGFPYFAAIYEFDPVAQHMQTFALLDCNYWDAGGLSFTPDGRKLQMWSSRLNQIVEVDEH